MYALLSRLLCRKILGISGHFALSPEPARLFYHVSKHREKSLSEFFKTVCLYKGILRKIFLFKTFISHGIKWIRYLWTSSEKDFSPCPENIQRWFGLYLWSKSSFPMCPTLQVLCHLYDRHLSNMVGIFFLKNISNYSSGRFHVSKLGPVFQKL